MISELDETIRQILVKEGGFDPSEIDVSFEIPNREWSAGISRPTVNCYLFDIRENYVLRQSGRVMDKQPAGAPNGAVRRRPPMHIDLTYLITAWTRAVEDEHRLLWHTLGTLMRFTVLPEHYLQGMLREHEASVYTSIGRPDGVLKSPGEFWTALENQIKPSLSYVVTLALDREVLPAGPPILATRLRFSTPDAAVEELLRFGGTIRDAAGVPVQAAHVRVEGYGPTSISDAEGRFVLSVPHAGHYTLSVHVGPVVQHREFDIPAASYDITVE